MRSTSLVGLSPVRMPMGAARMIRPIGYRKICVPTRVATLAKVGAASCWCYHRWGRPHQAEPSASPAPSAAAAGSSCSRGTRHVHAGKRSSRAPATLPARPAAPSHPATHLRPLQEGQGRVAQEGEVEVVGHAGGVEGAGEGARREAVHQQHRAERELEHVEQQEHGEVGVAVDVKGVHPAVRGREGEGREAGRSQGRVLGSRWGGWGGSRQQCKGTESAPGWAAKGPVHIPRAALRWQCGCRAARPLVHARKLRRQLQQRSPRSQWRAQPQPPPPGPKSPPASQVPPPHPAPPSPSLPPATPPATHHSTLCSTAWLCSCFLRRKRLAMNQPAVATTQPMVRKSTTTADTTVTSVRPRLWLNLQ